jgi:uncharacterized Zn finger protein (UPF0148 family)
METKELHCPNCSAPLKVPPGEVDVLCGFCESRLTFVPSTQEMEVVRTREEMKRKERVDVQRLQLQKQLQQEEAERWRQTAAHVAIAALPMVGTAMGRGLFNVALGRRGAGCLGCGCLTPVIGLLAAALAILFLR